MINTEKPRPKVGSGYCPLWRKPLSRVCHTCEWYVQIKGKDPQGEQTFDHWGCAIAWMPILQIEGTQQSRQAGASSDKVATEVAKLHETMKSDSAQVVSQLKNASKEYKRLREQGDVIDGRDIQA